MKKVAILAILGSSMLVSAQNTLTNFGTSAFTIVGDFTTNNATQTSTSVTFGSIPDLSSNLITGTISSADWSSYNMSTDFRVNLSLTTATSAPLTIELFTADGTSLATGSVTIDSVVSNQDFPIAFSGNPLSSVGAVGLKVTATGAMPLTVNSLAAVPEPSTYALMALGGLVLFFIARRRKAQQV